MDKNDIVAIIGAKASEVLPALEDHRFVAEDSLKDLGANSIDRAEILAEVLSELNLAIPRVELFGPRNIGELADLLLGKLPSA